MENRGGLFILWWHFRCASLAVTFRAWSVKCHSLLLFPRCHAIGVQLEASAHRRGHPDNLLLRRDAVREPRFFHEWVRRSFVCESRACVFS